MKNPSDTESFKRFWRHKFGATPLVCSVLWDRLEAALEQMPNNKQLKHLLWGLMLLRTYADEADLAKDAGGQDGCVDGKTFRKWAWLFVEAISFLEASVILWENRRFNDIFNDAMISVDGTDTPVQQFKPFWKGWYSHKLNGPGTRWEVGLCIRSRQIVWIHGPFPCGHWPDLKIFRHSMKSFLDDDEKAEADDGYVGEPTKILTPSENTHTQEDKDIRQRVRNRHETINSRFKNWKCLDRPCRHDLLKHSSMFRSVAVICQLSIENGETKLFDVDYDDTNFSIYGQNP